MISSHWDPAKSKWISRVQPGRGFIPDHYFQCIRLHLSLRIPSKPLNPGHSTGVKNYAFQSMISLPSHTFSPAKIEEEKTIPIRFRLQFRGQSSGRTMTPYLVPPYRRLSHRPISRVVGFLNIALDSDIDPPAKVLTQLQRR